MITKSPLWGEFEIDELLGLVFELGNINKKFREIVDAWGRRQLQSIELDEYYYVNILEFSIKAGNLRQIQEIGFYEIFRMSGFAMIPKYCCVALRRA